MVLNAFAAIVVLISLYLHNRTIVLALSAVLLVLGLVAFTAVSRGSEIKKEVPLPVLIVLPVVAAILGASVDHMLLTLGSAGQRPSPSPTHSASPPSSSRPSTPSMGPGGAGSKILFRDTFCKKAGDWATGSGQTGARYGKCALIIYTNAALPVQSSKPGAYPAAPPGGVDIYVTAQQIVGSTQGEYYGILCRADGTGYALWVRSDLAQIVKYATGSAIIGSPLDSVQVQVDMNARNKLHATCADSRVGVYLALWLNGHKVAQATDVHNPILGGTVGLLAASPGTHTATEVKFEDFKVTSSNR